MVKLSDLHLFHCVFLTATPLVALYGIGTVPMQTNTLIAAVCYYFLTGLGITGGYHRYWSHRTYECSLPFRIFLMLIGSGAVQGSIKWWSRDHRAHHRYTDTEKDPYSAHKGLLWSHIGWMFFQKKKENYGKVDISDLNRDPLVVFQHKYYAFIAMFMAFVFPSLFCGLLFDDYIGGFYFMGVARLVAIHHATFSINSVAHWLGEHSFDDRLSPKDSWVTALITLGEGYHNFHHEFPSDYRNAIQYYQYDPTKWIVKAGSYLGLTWSLKTFPSNEIKKGRLQMQQNQIEKIKKTINWGIPLNSLPCYTWDEFVDEIKRNQKKWLVIDSLIFDVHDFEDEHPGGKGFLKSAIGKDATTSFNGGVYRHSTAARNLMTHMRVGKIVGDIPKVDTFKEE